MVVVVTGGSLICLFVGIENACIYFVYSIIWWFMIGMVFVRVKCDNVSCI